MKKYLVEIEFRYSDAPTTDLDAECKFRKVTIGVYDDFDMACIAGNRLLENLESRFDIHTFPDGSEAKRERFGKTKLISNLAYLKTPFVFYAKIVQLNHENIDNAIENVLDSVARYKNYKDKEEVEK